jgi:hypothetical protein
VERLLSILAHQEGTVVAMLTLAKQRHLVQPLPLLGPIVSALRARIDEQTRGTRRSHSADGQRGIGGDSASEWTVRWPRLGEALAGVHQYLR